MKSTDDDRSRRGIHLRYLVWVLIVVFVVAGFHFFIDFGNRKKKGVTAQKNVSEG